MKAWFHPHTDKGVFVSSTHLSSTGEFCASGKSVYNRVSDDHYNQTTLGFSSQGDLPKVSGE